MIDLKQKKEACFRWQHRDENKRWDLSIISETMIRWNTERTIDMTIKLELVAFRGSDGKTENEPFVCLLCSN